MKDKPSFVTVYWWLFLLLLCGLGLSIFAPKEARVSESENRTLSGFPEVSWESLLSGEFSQGFESYLSDGVFGRDAMVGCSESLLRLFSANTAEDEMLLSDRDMADELQGKLPQTQETEPARQPEETVPAATQAATEPPEETVPEEEFEESVTVEGCGLFMKTVEGRYRRVTTVTDEQLRKVAEMLNDYRSCLPEDGNVFYTNVPLTASGLMLTYKERYQGWLENLDTHIAPYLDAGVHYINTPALLEAPILAGEHIYFLSDHHWTPEGAILVANACMERQGVPPVPYGEYEYKINLFANGAKGTVDEMPLLYPLQEVTGRFLPQGQEGKSAALIRYGGGTYTAYLTGDTDVWVRYVTGFSTGRKALVIGDSFSNAFTPYLAPYYDEVHKVDARYCSKVQNGGNIAELLEKYGIDDIYIIVSYANGVRSGTSLYNLRRVLHE